MRRIRERQYGRAIGVAENHFLARVADDGSALIGRDWKLGEHMSLARLHVTLPGAENQHIPLSHEKAVTGVRCADRVVGSRTLLGVVDVNQGQLVTPIGGVVQNAPITFAEVGGFEHAEIHRVFDPARGIRRRLVEINDILIEWIGGIDLAIGPPDYFLVRTGAPEGHIFKHVFNPLNL